MISNDKPFLVIYESNYYFPLFKTYPETTFGGIFETETDYRDPFFAEQMQEGQNRAFFPPNHHYFDTINYELDVPVPSPPTRENILGTDDRGRDVFARLLYGFRLSILFGLALTVVGTLIGIVCGAVQGYFGGRTDLFFQRFIEIWGAMPELYLLIIFASIFKPSALLLLVLLSFFSWMGLSRLVRGQIFSIREREYILASQAVGSAASVQRPARGPHRPANRAAANKPSKSSGDRARCMAPS